MTLDSGSLVEQLSKQAWLLLRTGPLAGKQFVVYKSPTTFGSDSRCDVYLFGDPLVEDRHTQLVRVGRAYEVQNLSSTNGTLVNGAVVEKRILRDGDLIVIGQTELEYRTRAT